MKLKRLIIYPKDIMLITGKSERYSRYLYKRIKKYFGKEDHQALSVVEFSNYIGADADEVSDRFFDISNSLKFIFKLISKPF